MDKDLLDYFMTATDKRLDSIEQKLDKLIQFRWMVVGSATGISFLVSIIFHLYGALNK